METQSTSKTVQLILMISLILIVILVVIVVMQYRYITEHIIDLKAPALSETSIKENQSGSKTVDPSWKMTGAPDSISDKEKITNLELQIADMQEYESYMEESLYKYETARNEKFFQDYKNIFSSRFKSFAEENNLSPDQINDLVELLAQRQLEWIDLARDKNSMDAEDYQNEIEYIKLQYDDLISDLLYEENYIAYQEFLKSEQDRPYIGMFKEFVFTGDNQLNKQQEKDLLAAIYRKRIAIEDTEKILISDTGIGTEQNFEYRKKWLNAYKKLLNGYLEASKDILTDSQMKKFEKYIDIQIASFEMEEKQLSQLNEIMNSDKEKETNQ